MTEEVRIPLLVGSEIHIANDGTVTVANPPAAHQPSERSASAVLVYQFDRDHGEHIVRLVEPMAAHPPRPRSQE